MEPNTIDSNVFLSSASTSHKRKCISPTTIDIVSVDYDMNKKRRGYAIILNHEYFEKEERRLGTETDKIRLIETLTKLGFDLLVYDDLERKEINEKLKEAANMGHTDNDCILIVVLTHGSEGHLEAKDGTYKENDVWEPFLSCKTLIGKPKLVFIQACRGMSQDKGHSVKPIKKGDQIDGSIEQPKLKYFSIPTTADLLIMQSTYYGHLAFRGENGTFFIQTLCDEFDGNGSVNDLLQLLTLVCKRVALGFTSHSPNKPQWDCLKQMPCFISTLTKKLVFTNKFVVQKQQESDHQD